MLLRMLIAGLAAAAPVSVPLSALAQDRSSEDFLIDPRASIIAAPDVPLVLTQARDGVAVEPLPTLPPNIQGPGEVTKFWTGAVFRGLDKITARVSEFVARVDQPSHFGAFDVTVRKCNKRPPEETPYTTAFVEVVETTLDGEKRPVFTGWMFATSPGLNAVEHPTYDVWLIDCTMASQSSGGG